MQVLWGPRRERGERAAASGGTGFLNNQAARRETETRRVRRGETPSLTRDASADGNKRTDFGPNLKKVKACHKTVGELGAGRMLENIQR